LTIPGDTASLASYIKFTSDPDLDHKKSQGVFKRPKTFNRIEKMLLGRLATTQCDQLFVPGLLEWARTFRQTSQTKQLPGRR
jgi:hypothetical protein